MDSFKEDGVPKLYFDIEHLNIFHMGWWVLGTGKRIASGRVRNLQLGVKPSHSNNFSDCGSIDNVL